MSASEKDLPVFQSCTNIFAFSRVNNSASMSSLRDLGFQSAPTATYTTTMPRGPFLQRHFSGISSHDLQNNNEPPPIRPRKPPRLIHYAQGGTLTRNNFTLGK
jgi:hypothetical protein